MADSYRTENDNSSTLGSTRQLLDELDELMEKMLALQVDGDQGAQTTVGTESQSSATMVEEPIPDEFEAEPESVEEESPELEKNADEETNYIYEDQPPDDEQADDDAASVDESDLTFTKESSSVPEELSAIGPSSMTKEILSALAARPEDTLPPALAERSRTAAKTRRTTRWWLWPLSAVNRGFDLCTYALGPFGRWLRQPGGRMTLGLLGVTLLLAAISVQILLWIAWN